MGGAGGLAHRRHPVALGAIGRLAPPVGAVAALHEPRPVRPLFHPPGNRQVDFVERRPVLLCLARQASHGPDHLATPAARVVGNAGSVASLNPEGASMDPIHKFAELDPRKKAFSLVEEFKNFAFKGNVIDLAVGVIIGAAFGKIIDSLVKQVLMPLITAVVPANESYTKWSWTINGQEVPYGLFLGEIVNFLLISVILFRVLFKFLGAVMKAK